MSVSVLEGKYGFVMKGDYTLHFFLALNHEKFFKLKNKELRVVS